MKKNVIKFGGNPRPAVRHDNDPIVIILPVVRIEGYRGGGRMPRRKRKRLNNPTGGSAA